MSLADGARAWARDRASRLARHPVAPLVAEGFLSRLSFGIVSFALPLFAYQRGMSISAIGVLLSLNLVVAMALKPLLGAATDRLGPKPALVVAIVLRSAVCLLLVFAVEPWQLFVVRGLHGVSIALRDPAAAVLVADAGGERSVAMSFAWYQTAKTLAGSIGRAVAGVLVVLTGGYAGAFAVSFVLSVLPLWAVVRGVRSTVTEARVVEPDDWVSQRTDSASLPASAPVPGAPPDHSPSRTSAPVFAYASVGFLITGSAYLMANLFPLFATEYAGLSPAAVGAIYLVGGLLALTGPAWGWLADHLNTRLVLSARSVANVGSSVLFLVAPNLAGVMAGKALDDMGKAAFRPAWGSLMADVANHDRGHRARIMAWLGVGEDAGEVAGPMVAALLWSAWGIPAVLVLRMIAAAAAEVVTIRVTGRVVAAPGKDAVPARLERESLARLHQPTPSTGGPFP